MSASVSRQVQTAIAYTVGLSAGTWLEWQTAEVVSTICCMWTLVLVSWLRSSEVQT